MSNNIKNRESREALTSNIDKTKYMRKDMEYFYSEKNVDIYFKKLKDETIIKYSKSHGLGYSVLTLSICGNLNVGTIMRTAQLLGADRYIVFGKRKFDTRSTVGAMKYMQVDRVFGLKDRSIDEKEEEILNESDRIISPEIFYKFMKDSNLVPIFLEQTVNAIYDDEINWNLQHSNLPENSKFCFVFGNEGDGIAPDIINIGLKIEGSFVIAIRQLGVLQSFNVSAAAAIILSKYKDWVIKKRLDWL